MVLFNFSHINSRHFCIALQWKYYSILMSYAKMCLCIDVSNSDIRRRGWVGSSREWFMLLLLIINVVFPACFLIYFLVIILHSLRVCYMIFLQTWTMNTDLLQLLANLVYAALMLSHYCPKCSSSFFNVNQIKVFTKHIVYYFWRFVTSNHVFWVWHRQVSCCIATAVHFEKELWNFWCRWLWSTS